MVNHILWRSKQYLSYILESKNTHGIHSPFVFDLLNNIVYNDMPFYSFRAIETYRKALKLNNEEIIVEDYGAGSSFNAGQKRKINQILQQSVKREKYAQLLFRLAERRQPEDIVELGTCLGITTLYLSSACPKSTITSIEGSKNIAGFANNVFKKFKKKNIELITGKFQDVIPSLSEKQKQSDFVFFDGHHDKKATLDYFNQFVGYAGENALYVFDDIHWSPGMKEAWNLIKEHEKVSLTIDLFEMGLVFFMPRNQKENFVIRF